jgi:hypothetical protein
MVTLTLLDEGRVVRTVNWAVVCPAGIVTEAGTVATVELLLRSGTTAPPGGAGALSVTMPVALLPPLTVLGEMLSDWMLGGTTVSVA